MTLLFRKIQNQIVALRQRGYPFDYIRVRATPAALDRMLREAAVKDPTAYESMTRYQDGRIFHCEIDLLEGILETAYAWVPAVHVQVWIAPDGFKMISLIDADTRILDEKVLFLNGDRVEFCPERVEKTGKGRASITGSITSVNSA